MLDASDVAEDFLSDEQHAEYDAAVNHEVQRDKRLTTRTSIVFPYLLATIARFSGGVIHASYQTYDEICFLYDIFSLTEKLTLAWKSGSYREIRNLALLRVPLLRSREMRMINAIRFAWIGEYYGDFHKVMLKNINSMERGPGRPSFANVVQSSGSGKSRMADEMANLVFTIPFNIRHRSDFSSEDYPLDDDDVLPYLGAFTSITPRVERRFVLFFHRLFSEVANEVKRFFCTENKLSPEELARQWKAHLSWSNNRYWLYRRVVKGSEYDEAAFDDDQTLCPRITLDTLLDVLNTVCDIPISNNIKVLLYFDVAHELDRAVGFQEPKKTLYDIAWSTLDCFKGYDVFTLFLSTKLPRMMAARYTEIVPLVGGRQFQAPITETPFDCHPCFPLRPGQLSLKELGELPFLARFGRPLFWTMIEAPADGHLERIGEVMASACSRIASDNDIYLNGKSQHSDIAMLAVLDILVSIDYDSNQVSTRKTQLDMVASHMRTIFSIPVHGPDVHSGYPSEPFLAEAASRQMHRYLTTVRRYGGRIQYGRIVNILGLSGVSRGGRMVMRVLLRKAYMDAIVAEQPCDVPNFSKGCSFLQFLKALFADHFHSLILKSQPDNYEVESRCSALEDAFEHAVVRFTHFVRAADDSLVDTHSMISAFVRGYALIIRENKLALDVVIPILLDRRSELTESSMSALFIRVKRREHLGGTEAYTIDAKTFGFFPEKQDPRPYVTLVAELGADVPSFTGQASNTVHSNDTRTASTLDADHPRYSIRAYGCTTAAWKVVGDHPSAYVRVLGEEGLSGEQAREGGPNAETLAVVRPSAAVEVGPYRYASVPADEVPE